MKSRLRLSEAATVLCVLALTVAAAWPALGIAFGVTGNADAPTQNPGAPTAGRYNQPAPTSTTQDPPVTLTVLAPKYGSKNDQTYWDDTVGGFRAANPRITVNVKQVDRSSLVAEARSDLAAGSVDLVLGVYADDVATAAASGQLYAQSDLVYPSKGLLPDFNYREEGTGPGGNPEMYGIPFSGSALALYCNMSVFMAADVDPTPPTTWTELAADAAKIKAAGKIGYGLAMAPGEAATTAQMWMGGDGGRGFSSFPGNRGWSVNMPANAKALSWIADNLVKPGRTEPHPETETTQDLEQQFAAGNIGMMVADSTLLPQMQDAGFGTATRVVPMPGIAGPVPGTIASVDDFLASKAHPEHKKAITEFLDYVLTPPATIWFSNIHGTLPLTRNALDAEGVQIAAVAPFLPLMTQVEWLPTRNPAWPAVEKAIEQNLARTLTGDPQPILDKIQAIAMAASPAR